MPTCIDLRQKFGAKLRIGHDPMARTRAEKRDPWMLTLPCRLGVIYPHGGNRLAVEVDHHPKAARRLAAIPGVALIQDGDKERTFLFDVALFDQVAAVVRPRRRRRLTPEQKARLDSASRPYRFAKDKAPVPGAKKRGANER